MTMGWRRISEDDPDAPDLQPDQVERLGDEDLDSDDELATMAPTGARIGRVIPSRASRTNFSHISSTIWSLSTESNLPCASSAARAVTRALRVPSRSPTMTRWSLFRCSMRPPAPIVAAICATPPSTRAAPKRLSSRSRWLMPLSIGKTALFAPIAGAMLSMAPSRS